MDVLPAEAQKLRQLITLWSEHPDYELEATFGAGGKVDATAFFAVAARLRAKGYEPLAQEDRLNILLPEHIRTTIVGSGLIQQYCRDDTLSGKPFVAMIKDRTFIESNLDLDEYDTRVKIRRELEIAPDDARMRDVLERWSVQRKAFRLIRRWSFAGKGIQFDLSIVRSTRTDTRGDYKWVRSFKEHNFLKEPASYEVEVEIKRPAGAAATTDVDTTMKDLVRGIGEVLRGIQRNSILMRKSVRTRVLAAYQNLVGSDLFRGVAPVTLETENMSSIIEDGVPNIRTGYNVTDKADGLRVLAFCDRKGELFMIDMAMNIYRTGLSRPACAESLLDGEWITKDKHGNGISQLLLFDIYFTSGGVKVDDKPFVVADESGAPAMGAGEPESRYAHLRRWTGLWNEGDGPTITVPGVTQANKLLVAEKQFYIAAPGTKIFRYAARTLDKERMYNTDGLIFTPNSLPLPARPGDTFRAQFKWKPAHDNTIDFLVTFEKDVESPDIDKVTIGINPTNGETSRYKTMRLYVGSARSAAEEDPRSAILFGQKFIEAATASRRGPKDNYRPVLFNPTDYPDTMAATAYRSVELDLETGDEFVLTEGTQEPIRDRSIVEMMYDPAREPGWRWAPLRVRHDKTERLQRGVLARTLNSEKVANSVWNSIHDPITLSMIRTGAEEPTAEEVAAIQASRAGMEEIGKKYYERKAPAQDLLAVRGLRDFHNRYIKETILYRVALRGGGKRLLDVACGKAGDLQKWRRGNVAFVLGVDAAGENIRDPLNGAYRRYADTVAGRPAGQVPPMVFAIGDSSQPLVDGTAGATPEERDILRSVFGRVRPEGAVPPYLETTAAGALRAGADAISCMFAIHYFFEDAAHLNGLLENINQILKVGGYFVGCAFDGERVFNLLRDVPRGQSRVGKSGETLLWTITKEYDAEELTDDDESLGMAIDVEFVSIGTKQREYLVPFKLLVAKMKEIGCELLTPAEAKAVQLNASTNLFDVSYAMAEKAGKKYTMEESVREFSFLNRWFIFQRKGAAPTVAAVELAAAEAVPATEAEARAEVEVPEVAAVEAANLGAESAAMPTAVVPSETIVPPTLTIRRKKTATAAPTPAAGISVIREVPVSAPVAAGRSFAPAEIFQFYGEASLKDVLKIGDPGAGRWLSPGAPFPIKDPRDGKMYPSVEHYYAGMKYKLATDKPALAISLMSQEGRIHQKYLAQRQAETGAGARPLSQDRDTELLKMEIAEVKAESRPQAMAKYGAVYDDAAWLSIKDTVLREGLTYRWTHDKRLRAAVEGARNAGKYLLYYTGSASGSELGGKRRPEDGVIDGANKVGKILMELANFPPF